MSQLQQAECPHCHARFPIESDFDGERVTCPDCLEEFVWRPAAIEPGGEPPAPADMLPDRWEDLLGEAAAFESSPTWTPAVEGGSTLPAAVDATRSDSSFDFSFVCPLCGTRQDSDSGQIGQSTQCPDCHLVFAVPIPEKAARRPRGTLRTSDHELRLADSMEPEPMKKLAQDWLASAAREAARSAPLPAARMGQAKSDAPRGHDEPAGDGPDAQSRRSRAQPVPRLPLYPHAVRFLFHPTTVGRWVIMSLALHLEWLAIDGSITFSRVGGLEQIVGVLLRVVACIWGGLVVCYISTSLAHLTLETSHGSDVIEGWPGINVTEWFFESWPVIASLGLTGIPGLALGHLAYVWLNEIQWLWITAGVLGCVGLVLLFPILVLSFLENGSPYSRPVWHSLRQAWTSWRDFWLAAALIVLVQAVMVLLRLRSHGWVVNIGLALVFTLLAMTYFRLLGQLSRACAEVVEVEQPVEEGENELARRE